MYTTFVLAYAVLRQPNLGTTGNVSNWCNFVMRMRRLPPSSIGQRVEGLHYPFTSLSFSLDTFACKMHRDRNDTGMGFIMWFLHGKAHHHDWVLAVHM